MPTQRERAHMPLRNALVNGSYKGRRLELSHVWMRGPHLPSLPQGWLKRPLVFISLLDLSGLKHPCPSQSAFSRVSTAAKYPSGFKLECSFIVLPLNLLTILTPLPKPSPQAQLVCLWPTSWPLRGPQVGSESDLDIRIGPQPGG